MLRIAHHDLATVGNLFVNELVHQAVDFPFVYLAIVTLKNILEEIKLHQFERENWLKGEGLLLRVLLVFLKTAQVDSELAFNLD